jgi:two-component system C4-dicarboxylate transport sensor histidine kinase DctB
MSDTAPPDRAGAPSGIQWWIRLAIVALCIAAGAVVWVTNQVLTERYTASTRTRSEVRLALFSGSLISELRRHAIVPLLLSRDPRLISALSTGDFSQSSQRLIDYRDETGAARLALLDREGRTVASSERVELGAQHRQDGYFVNALRSNETVFTTFADDLGRTQFIYSRKVEHDGVVVGVIVVEVGLQKYEQSWAGMSEAILVADSSGVILLSTEPGWRGITEEQALAAEPATNAIERALRARTDWSRSSEDVYLSGEAVMRSETRVPFQGWKLVSFTTFMSVRESVNTVLAIEVMGFALLMAGLFYLMSRLANRRSAVFQRESAELRELNAMLQHEIAERQKAEKNLEVAEQSLAQHSKLAALGEMATAVSHELNQPLAAMKTYLAGSRLLLQRRRTDESLSSLQRINDLIDRMAAITRQLKSYAHKGGDGFERVDLRDAISGSIAMMEPQFKQRHIRIGRTQPDTPVHVLGDRIRIEQVIINLLRNAVDATKRNADPEIDIILSVGNTATLTVRDNGDGIEDLESLFEPFYTTKAPGEGVGLGLAISSGIIADMGGRLTARNRSDGGAVFEIQLPLFGKDSMAAE